MTAQLHMFFFGLFQVNINMLVGQMIVRTSYEYFPGGLGTQQSRYGHFCAYYFRAYDSRVSISNESI